MTTVFEQKRTLIMTDVQAQAEYDERSTARNIALRQLANSPKTRQQLEQTLAKKGVAADVAAEVLDRLAEVGLVDDLAYAHLLVRSRCAAKRISRSSLMRELRAKGVADDVIGIAVADIDEAVEFELAREAATKKLRSMRGLHHEVVVRRLVGMLARKGFSSALAIKVVQSLELDSENLTKGDYILSDPQD